jgi:hypothetical protein
MASQRSSLTRSVVATAGHTQPACPTGRIRYRPPRVPTETTCK